MHNPMPLVSVIIPTFNRALFVSKAIDSVLEQTYKNIEIIVIDDGSTDNTKEILTVYHDKIKYEYKSNGGVSSARNLGIKEACGEYVAFLDSDDSWYPEKIMKQMNKINMFQDYKIAISDIEFTDESGKHLYFSNLRKIILKDGYIFKYILKRINVTCSYMLIKKDVFSKIGVFDENFNTAEDIDLLFKICSKFKAVLVDEPLIKYRIHNNSLHNSLFTKNSIKAFKKIKEYAPEVAECYKNCISKNIAMIHMKYAEDLLWNRYIDESKKQVLESLRNYFAIKALPLYIKCFMMQVLSLFIAKYKDRGSFGE